ncbi:hypothetical protein B0H14DRAFT_3615758 [Mycena olivaceomarginata]|nr:hypothetical protein B0H14DRAFT_3615758 [Mycena olivaceomarginata]
MSRRCRPVPLASCQHPSLRGSNSLLLCPLTLGAGRSLSSNTPESQILPKLSSQSSADLVPLIPLLLSWLVYPSTSADRDNSKHLSRETRDEISDLLISRLTAVPPSTSDPLVAQIQATLSNPSSTADSAKAKDALFHYHGVLPSLLKKNIEPYRDALTRIAWTSTPEETARGLGMRCRYLLEFLDSSQARVPHSKSDELAVRSLELVHTAEECASDPRGAGVGSDRSISKLFAEAPRHFWNPVAAMPKKLGGQITRI